MLDDFVSIVRLLQDCGRRKASPCARFERDAWRAIEVRGTRHLRSPLTGIAYIPQVSVDPMRTGSDSDVSVSGQSRGRRAITFAG
jgi:hypothetical protein